MLRSIYNRLFLVGFIVFFQSEIGFSASPDGHEENSLSEVSVLDIPAVGIKITPPVGWSANQDVVGLTLVMKEPVDPKPDYEKPKYQRNITVMTLHQPSPIDFARMEQLKQELAKQFSQTGGASQFQIVEAKIFDYRHKNDGILVYSSVNIGEYPMMQMHVLVSGQNKQYLMTYTDLADRFTQSNDPVFSAAWASMMSLEVEGVSPTRFEQNKGIYLTLGGFGLMGIGLGLWSFMRRRTSYRHYADLAVSGRDLDDDFTYSSCHATTLNKPRALKPSKKMVTSAVSLHAASSSLKSHFEERSANARREKKNFFGRFFMRKSPQKNDACDLESSSGLSYSSF